MAQIGLKWSKMGQNGPKWFKSAKINSKTPKTPKTYPELSICVDLGYFG